MQTPPPQSLRTRRLAAELYARMLADQWSRASRPSSAPHFKRRTELADALASDGRFPEPVDATPLHEVAGPVDRARWVEATRNGSRSVVFRGYVAQTASRWTLDGLREQMGDTPCTVMHQDAESRKRNWDTGTKLVELPFDELIERLPHEDLYLNNSTEIFVSHPELVEELQLDRLRDLTTPGETWDELLATNFFVGSRRVHSSIHAAWGGNFFLNLIGRKRWRFIAPEYSAYLNPIPARPFDYATSAHEGFRAAEQEGREDAIFFRLPHQEVMLEPGDMLYVAPWWWHEVDNHSDVTVACAVRHAPAPSRSPSAMLRNCPPMALCSRFPRSRALMMVHYVRHHLAGGEASMLELVNQALWQRLRTSLDART